MLKKICKLFLGLMVCAGSACVTPTHASSAPQVPLGVILTKVQAAGPLGARVERIELYNASSSAASLHGWCLVNKLLVSFACFDEKTINQKKFRATLPAGAYATIVSSDFLASVPGVTAEHVSLVYSSINQSSGALVGSADSLVLINEEGDSIDALSWQSAISNTKLYSRQVTQVDPLLYSVTGTSADWQQSLQESTVLQGVEWVEYQASSDSADPTDPSDDSDPEEPEVPADSQTGEAGDSTALPLEITELLPNAAGSDAGNEFIEFYNPNTVAVRGQGYELLVGATTVKVYTVPATFIVEPLSYAVLKNDTTKYSLSNTSGAVQLRFNGQNVGPTITYISPKDGESWALIEGEWQYTGLPTPGSPNDTGSVLGLQVPVALSIQKPCAENQYRNVETGRCKLITVASVQSPCKEGQVRNVETGRCRNIASSTGPAPCKAGQERNAETGRCRNIVKMTKASDKLVPSEKTQVTSGPAWYVWIGVGGIISAILGYGVWEWRQELRQVFQRVREKFAKHAS